ncbi:MAG: hypothetical protein JST09_16630 [Bacteroidetes bacterium]|nr:hypothetical protein [Bacteroidota bacterium]MBS1609425.1 hypothetical protein [Bacteroidota bacterium]
MKKTATLMGVLALYLLIFLNAIGFSQKKRLNSLNNRKPKKTAVVQSPNTGIPLSGNTVTPYTLISSEVRVFPSSNPQSEIHISINKTNPQALLLSSNTTQIGSCIQGAYWSTNGGANWSGSDALPNNANGKGDPSTAFDALGNGFVATMTPASGNFNAEPVGYSIQRTANNGATWAAQVNGVNGIVFDKDMIATDDLPASPFANSFYCGWMGANNFVQFNRSIDHGATFSQPLTLTNYWGQGANRP